MCVTRRRLHHVEMKEESKASFDVALSALGGQFGCSIQGPFEAIDEAETLKVCVRFTPVSHRE